MVFLLRELPPRQAQAKGGVIVLGLLLGGGAFVLGLGVGSSPTSFRTSGLRRNTQVEATYRIDMT